MKAPDKIYLHIRPNKEIGSTWHGNKISDTDIEYTSTDAFIEKAVDWWMDNFVYTDDVDIKYKTIQNFKNYLKGEMYEKDYTKGRR